MASRTYYSEEARSRAQIERSLIAALCLAVGVAVGTVIALLFAPNDGATLRHTLAEKAGDVAEQAEKTVKKIAG